MLTIKFLTVGCADGIHIRFFGSDMLWHNILIDGGKGSTYCQTLKITIEEIALLNETIDYWIISHIDDDHIGALLYALKRDEDTLSQVGFFTSTVVYNYSLKDNCIVKQNNNNLKSISQGMSLIEYLSRKNIKIENNITNNTSPIAYHGAEIEILSPTQEYFDDFINQWQKQEIKQKTNKLKSLINGDYNEKYSILIDKEFCEDKSFWNKSSIAFLFRFMNKAFLFTADSSSAVLYESLTNIGYSQLNKLNVEFMQLPHHGSKNNVSDNLLEIINCNNYIICSDDINKHKLPNKEALCRVVKHNITNTTNFYFTNKFCRRGNIFKMDNEISNNINIIDTQTNLIINLEDGKIIYSKG